MPGWPAQGIGYHARVRNPLTTQPVLSSALLAVALLVALPVRAAETAGPASASDRLILLGTAGGPAPKKARAQPANALVVGGELYVIDAGNGVSRQLALAGVPVNTLRAVFITHHHSDHNADYGTLVLRAVLAGLRDRVDAYGPPPLRQMTAAYIDYMRWDIELRVEDEGRPHLRDILRPHDIEGDGVVYEDERLRVTAAEVPHGAAKPSYAYRFDIGADSVVFSGDTAYSEKLAELAEGAGTLVHEVLDADSVDAIVAHFDPGNAALRRHILDAHTSIADVGRVAASAGVERLVLSHFVPSGWPDYDRPENWLAGVRRHYDGEVIVGEDLMVIGLSP